jgi:Ethylbenzene dehydrogenase
MRTAGPLPLLALCCAACLEAPKYAHAPADTAFAVGVVDGRGNVPQSSSAVKLTFVSGKPGPSTVVAARVTSPITVDGDGTDWDGIAGSEIPLVSPGGIIGMTQDQWNQEWLGNYVSRGICTAGGSCWIPPYDNGVRSITVKVAYDDARVWFYLRWADATESRRNRPWVYQVDPATGVLRWMQDGTVGDDKLFLSFDIASSFKAQDAVGCAALCHVKDDLGVFTDPTRTQRFTMHTDAPGQLVDGWSWRASTTDPLGLADDQFYVDVGTKGDCPDPAPLADALAGTYGCTQLCVSGRTPPCSAAMTTGNGTSTAGPAYMSPDGPSASPLALFAAGAGTPVAVPLDATVTPAAGSLLPGSVLQLPPYHRGDVQAKGIWKDGFWTVELSRALVTGDTFDAQFPTAP